MILCVCIIRFNANPPNKSQHSIYSLDPLCCSEVMFQCFRLPSARRRAAARRRPAAVRAPGPLDPWAPMAPWPHGLHRPMGRMGAMSPMGPMGPMAPWLPWAHGAITCDLQEPETIILAHPAKWNNNKDHPAIWNNYMGLSGPSGQTGPLRN